MRKFLYILSLFLISSNAYARRDQRDGVNFGTTLRVIDDTRTVDSGDSRTTYTSSSYSVSPFVGYVFLERFNLGLNSTIESSSLTERKEKSDTKQTTQTLGKLTGIGLFGRLLFGKVFFLEADVSAYRGRTTQIVETTKEENSQFTGTSDSTTTSGVGYGYAAGIGLEIPMGDGFYFTAAYMSRQLNLKDYEDPNSSTSQHDLKSDIQFGIMHYLR